MSHFLFRFTGPLSPLEEKTLKIFDARLAKRNTSADPGFTITVTRDPHCAEDEFRLSGSADAKDLRLDCGGPAAFLYAAGKILRTGKYENGRFSPGLWRGTWKPEKPVRCVYFASHFYNVYEVSPIEKMEEYIEDLALLGYNYLTMTAGSCAKLRGSPETIADLNRRIHLLKYGNFLGMKTRLGVGNQGYDDSPKEWRATPTGHSFFGTEICVNNPDGLAYLVKKNREMLEPFKDLDVDMISYWPYDQGGCGCDKCRPYGGNGMFKLAEATLPMIRELFPKAEICWCTWEFDWRGQDLGEWSTLYRKIADGSADYIKVILADDHGSFPAYPLTHPLPDGVKLITFPEISMWGRAPWGGFGATPLPKRFSALFGEVAHVSSGGVLYSEGIFEDFNKALYSEFWASGTNETGTAIREYARYEFGLPESALPDFYRLLDLMESNHEGLIWIEKQESYDVGHFDQLKSKPIWSYKGKTWHDTDEMLELARKLESQMPDWAKRSWRWRLFMLRAIIDFELAHNGNDTNAVTEKAMLELAKLYCISPITASRRVSPFTDEWIRHHVEKKYQLNMKTLGVD